ncbi:MAG: hypothetical protein HY901_33210 [Deltaproteobacteria bacterium]|nr:hypothetical protein [Deltaproteobacteria bacterium]
MKMLTMTKTGSAMRTLILAALTAVGSSSTARAATPAINSVTGTVASGQTLTIAGSNLVQEATSNWHTDFQTGYGFEGSSHVADGWVLPGDINSHAPAYDSAVRLSGNKSAKFRISGASQPGPGGLTSYLYHHCSSQDIWIRGYVKLFSANNEWAIGHSKMIDWQGTGFQFYFQPGASDSLPTLMTMAYDGTGHNGSASIGSDDTWHLFELHWKSAPKLFAAYWDNVLMDVAAPSNSTPGTMSYILLGFINAAGTTSAFDATYWFDNVTVSSSRIYPSSTIEVSGDGVTWKYQTPVYLSDTSSQFKLDLSGLSGTNYRLRVTNNQQQTSAVYSLSPGPTDTEPPLRSNGSPAGALAAGTASTTVSLATHENATCRYATQPGTAFAAMTGSFQSTGGTSHSVAAAGLANGRSYAYYARCRDAAGNANPDDFLISFSVADETTPGQTGTLLFAESFDDASMAARGWYDNTNILISTSEHAAGSTGSAQFRFDQGATTPTSGGAMRKLFTPTDTLYMSYWLKYDASWQDQATFGHHEILLLTDQNDAWSNLAFTRLTAYVESWGTPGQSVPVTPHVSFQDGQNIDQSRIGVDLTQVTEARAACGCNGLLDGLSASCYDSGTGVYWNGKSLAGGAALSLGQWRHVEVFIKLNSVINGKGVADGTVTYWLDGQQLFSSNKVSMRTGQWPNMKFNQFVIAPWMGNGSPRTQNLWLDKLEVWSGMPNGTVKPRAPMNLRVR